MYTLQFRFTRSILATVPHTTAVKVVQGATTHCVDGVCWRVSALGWFSVSLLAYNIDGYSMPTNVSLTSNCREPI